ncbi:MAG TPA: SPFH domain-containing protein [Actinomycetota bacterium]
MTTLIVVGAVAGLFVLLFLTSSIKIVPEYKRIVLFRLGRMIGLRGPGLTFLIPIIDKPVWVDMREFYLDIPHQTSITKDNAPISIDFIVFSKVVDAAMSVTQIDDFAGAAQNVASTTLRSIVGDMSLDDVLAKRDHINQALRIKLDEITERWGVKVTNVEIREVIPPPAVQEAMTRQMSAERTRRAVVLEADGSREAAITVATGDKQANILQAEGERQASILRAEGFALALRQIFEAASVVDAKTMGIQYLEALKVLGDSPSTKFVLPMEFTSMMRGIGNYVQNAFTEDKPA